MAWGGVRDVWRETDRVGHKVGVVLTQRATDSPGVVWPALWTHAKSSVPHPMSPPVCAAWRRRSLSQPREIRLSISDDASTMVQMLARYGRIVASYHVGGGVWNVRRDGARGAGRGAGRGARVGRRGPQAWA